MKTLNTVVVGAYGKMGQEIIRGILQSPDLKLVGAVDVSGIGQEVGELLGVKETGVFISKDLATVLDQVKVDVVIDFSRKDAATVNIPIALNKQVTVVMGTTGFTPAELDSLGDLAQKNQVGIFFAANFSLGAVLMMKYAREIAKFYPQAEILEFHNDKKIDSPSGTAIATARGMREAAGLKESSLDTAAAARGEEFYGYQVHSIRLQSFVAHQEVIFSGIGELLTIRHDSYKRESFIPGVLLAVRKVENWKGLKIGLESILDYFATTQIDRSESK